ncbi:UNVERIFIED_CONTAM: hypothetical protein Slati_4228000 [Sesamum latifolium]|uniref:DUF4218 domain-containing protein n=1 Tax=Sesamum latifolium TaxID=2727402 RepID=A0AAW2TE32_9LAMI
MEHLPIHLAEEALLAGPVQFRWMYPIERYLSTLKRYVRNRAHPEGSIARGYLMEECMNFCSRYLNDVETKENRPPRNYDGDNNVHNLRRATESNVSMELIALADGPIQHAKRYNACIVGGCRYREKGRLNVVVTMTRRDNYDVYSTIEVEPHSRVQLDDNIPIRNEDVCWVREGVEGMFVDETMMTVENVEEGNEIEIEDDFDLMLCMGKEKKSRHGKTMLEIMEMKKKKNSTKMNQSNDFEDSSHPVSPTRQQVRTMEKSWK